MFSVCPHTRCTDAEERSLDQALGAFSVDAISAPTFPLSVLYTVVTFSHKQVSTESLTTYLAITRGESEESSLGGQALWLLCDGIHQKLGDGMFAPPVKHDNHLLERVEEGDRSTVFAVSITRELYLHLHWSRHIR